MTTFAPYAHLPEPVRMALSELEDFIGEVDGKDICIPTDGNTVIDDGTVDAEDAVKAFNVIVSTLTSAYQDVER